ncbi:MAG: zinc ribbon domain-containing protein [Haloferacaceae archaeon]
MSAPDRDRSTPSDRGLAAAGAYLPRYRLATDETESAWGVAHARGIERKAVPAADEDALTMAAAASEAAIGRWDEEDDRVELVAVATTTPPLAEELLAARLVRLLGLPDAAAPSTHTGSTAAGAAGLCRALDADGPALVVAADCPEGDPADADHRLGAGAAAFVVTDDAAVPVRDRSWRAVDAPGVRYRERGERGVEGHGATAYERAAVREAVAGAVDGLDVDPAIAAGVALHQPDGDLPYRLARGLPVANDAVAAGTVADRVGDAGAATVPLGLLAALDGASDGDVTLAGFFGGGGGACALAFEGGLDAGVDGDVAGGRDLTYAAYLRERGHVVDGDVAGGGAHVSLPTWRRTLDARHHLAGGRCPDCGALAFPPEGACPSCHERVDFEAAPLRPRGTVRAATSIAQGGAPPEFAELQARDGTYDVAVVELTDGEANVTVPAMVADAEPGAVGIGDEVRAVRRRIYEQEGVPRYGVKFTPVER